MTRWTDDPGPDPVGVDGKQENGWRLVNECRLERNMKEVVPFRFLHREDLRKVLFAHGFEWTKKVVAAGGFPFPFGLEHCRLSFLGWLVQMANLPELQQEYVTLIDVCKKVMEDSGASSEGFLSLTLALVLSESFVRGEGENMGPNSGGFKRMSTALIVVLFAVASGCSWLNPPTFEPEDLKDVRTDVDYRMVEKHWKRLTGEKVIVGGKVDSVDNRTNRAFIRLIPMPLDENDHPIEPESTRGYLLLVVDGPVDPSRLSHGKEITVIGVVRRMRYPVALDSGGYLHLVTLDVLRMHTWLPRVIVSSPPMGPVMTPPGGGPYVPGGGIP